LCSGIEFLAKPLQQRPLYKSYARCLAPLRKCKQTTPDEVLRSLPKLFRGPEAELRLDRSWEYTEGNDPENVKKFNKLKLLRNGRLLDTEDGLDLYFVALNSKTVYLTELGRLYWRLAKKGFI